MTLGLDSEGRLGMVTSSPALCSQQTIPISIKEWSDMNRRIGYLEGVLEMLMDGDAETWVRAAREHYRTVYLGLPVVMKPEGEPK